MTSWRPWNRAEAPEELARYAQTDTTWLLLPTPLGRRLPGPGDDRSAQEKARAIYETLSEVGIHYDHEPATSPRGGQTIRTPHEVLHLKRKGTCLDLALLYAGACLDAGLRPMVVVVDSNTGVASHAVVVVWLGGRWTLSGDEEGPFDGELFTTPPHLESGTSLIDALRASTDAPGAFVAVDVQAMARTDWEAPRAWNDAVREGHRVLAATAAPDGEWRWGFGIDVGESRRSREPRAPRGWSPSKRQKLARPYAEPANNQSPLAQLKARSGRVPFVARDELDQLLHWADPGTSEPEQRDRGGRPKVSVHVVTGVGGSGKTHLAAELCRRLAAQGWYAGFLPRPLASSPRPSESLSWLGEVVAPVLAVVDYADEYHQDYLTEVLEALATREQPTRVLLTARADGPWLTNLASALQDSAAGVRIELPLPLARSHPDRRRLYARTFRRFAGDDPTSDPEAWLPRQINWTTLDVVLLAWLAADADDSETPTTREDLYERVLFVHEFPYWQRTLDNELRPPQQPAEATATPREPAEPDAKKASPFTLVPSDTLATAGAALTLVAPDADHAEEVLGGLGPRPANEPSWGQIGQVLARLLDEPGDGLAVRPDPVGEYLVLRQFTGKPPGRLAPGSPGEPTSKAPKPFDPKLLESVLPQAPVRPKEPATTLRREAFVGRSELVRKELARITLVVTRAAQLDRFWASALAEECLAIRPHMWPQALARAWQLGGPFAGALETALDTLSALPDNPLPLEELAQVPLGHGALRGLALAATRALRPVLPESPESADLAGLAEWLNSYSVRLAEMGDRTGALKAIDEAVTIRRQLAE
ncbi:MAG TPA: hypothetical protein PKE40_15145, partial [Arachnia sp.]|nr:hypothetical protein [Arachnia sp.]HMT87679.1 hypothetical protein [Arachnia sp.]